MDALAADPFWLTKKPCKSGRYAGAVTADELKSLFHLPAEQAARLTGTSSTIFKKLCRKHGITRWPYRGLKAQATAALSHTPGGGVQPGGVATQAAAAAQLPALLLSQPGTPTAWARCPARAGAGASPSPLLVSASSPNAPAIDTAGSGSSSMHMFLLRGSGTCEGSGPMPALQRCYTPFVAPAGGSGPSFDQQLGQPATGLAAPAAHGSRQHDSGTIAPSASAACLKSLLKRAAALAGEESMLQALLEEIHSRRLQQEAEPNSPNAVALACLQATVVSKLAQAEVRAAAAELGASPAWGPRQAQQAQQAAQLPRKPAESAAGSPARPKLHGARSQPARARPVVLAARPALPRSPFESSNPRPAPASLCGSLPTAAARPPQPFVPVRPTPGRALTPATLQLVHAPRLQPPVPPSLATARLATLQLRFSGSTAGPLYGPATPAWPTAAQSQSQCALPQPVAIDC